MQLNGKIISFSGKQVVINLDEVTDWTADELVQLPRIELEVDSAKEITIDQRKKAFAMLHDIAEYTGYSLRESEEMMKIRYISTLKNPKFFSLADCRRETATDFIQFMINFCLEQSIPFTTKVFDEIQQSYALRVQLLKHRICYICGKPNADVDHVDTIGAGRNRRETNQNGLHAWTLCRKSHQERHRIGVKSFAQKYQIKPVKLTPELIRYLNLANERSFKNEKSD
ncbi:MAG: putative HNHc nuclease [Staphylococcus epidermidis]|nr:putative HNHc nuclease [Staphylococcus epidermidis]